MNPGEDGEASADRANTRVGHAPYYVVFKHAPTRRDAAGIAYNGIYDRSSASRAILRHAVEGDIPGLAGRAKEEEAGSEEKNDEEEEVEEKEKEKDARPFNGRASFNGPAPLTLRWRRIRRRRWTTASLGGWLVCRCWRSKGGWLVAPRRV